jgi:flagellar biosynthesis protein FlhG
MRLSDVKLGNPRDRRRGTARGAVQSIAVTSANCGAGKTSIAANLAVALAMEGRRILLLDTDPGAADVHALLDLQPEFSLMDVLSDKCRLSDALVRGPYELMIVRAASTLRQYSELGATGYASLIRVFSELNQPLDTLVIDAASETTNSIAGLCNAANEVMVIVADEPPMLDQTLALIKFLYSRYAIGRFHILANRVLNAREGNRQFAKILDLLADEHNIVVSYAGFIPHDEALGKAEARRRAVVEIWPRSRSAMALRNLATRTARWPRPEQPRGHLEFFVERLIQQNNVEMEVLS